MAFNLSWLLEQRIIYVDASGQVTASELQRIVNTIPAYIRQGSAPVYAILDLTHVDKFPTQINAFRDFQFPPPEPNTGMLILISANKLALFIVGVVAQLSKRHIYTFSTLDDGLSFLARKDTTLPWFNLIQGHVTSI